MLVINGVVVVAPQKMSVSVSDIDANTSRNANGDIVRDRVAVKRKISCEWGLLTQEQMQIILNAVSSVFFDVSYIDPQQGQVTKNFYVGDRTSPVFSFSNSLKPWSGLKMNFIER